MSEEPEELRRATSEPGPTELLPTTAALAAKARDLAELRNAVVEASIFVLFYLCRLRLPVWHGTAVTGTRCWSSAGFRKFAELQSVRQVLWFSQENGLVPAIVAGRGKRPIEWKAPVYHTLHHILNESGLFGSYAYGRRGTRVTIRAAANASFATISGATGRTARF